MIVVIDYGVGNVGSIMNMLHFLGIPAILSSLETEITNATHLILPGVGAFDEGMRKLHERNLVPILNLAVKEKKIPILGICLGMQLLGVASEEGVLSGLGWMNFVCKKFSPTEDFDQKIPHMGWNSVTKNKESPLLDGFDDEFRFYFVHSYYALCNDESSILLTTNYGSSFSSAVSKGNIFGVQFHPEKSRKYGMKLLSNFYAIKGN